MNEERMKILNMLSEGKISAEDAESLLTAIDAETGSSGNSEIPKSDQKKKEPKYLFVTIEPKAEGGDAVNIRVPFRLLKAGVKLASLIPKNTQDKVNAAMDEEGVDMKFDFDKLNSDNPDEFFAEFSELSVDIDNEKETVKIFCQ